MATTEAMEILEGIKGTPEWFQMQAAMQQEKQATWQQTLAVHTSTCCQKDRAPALVASLEAAGLRDAIHDDKSGKIQVHLSIPFLFSGTLDWEYTSEWHDSLAQAKEAACFDTLCALLMLGPHLVKLHPNSLKRGAHSVSALREMGNNVTLTDQRAAQCKEAFAELLAVPELEPKGSPNPEASAPGAASSSGAAPAAAAAAAAPAHPYEHVEELLRRWYQGKGWTNPGRNVAPQVRNQLQGLVRKGQLKRTLQAHPDKFAVRDIPNTNEWEFLVKG